MATLLQQVGCTSRDVPQIRHVFYRAVASRPNVIPRKGDDVYERLQSQGGPAFSTATPERLLRNVFLHDNIWYERCTSSDGKWKIII